MPVRPTYEELLKLSKADFKAYLMKNGWDEETADHLTRQRHNARVALYKP